MEREKLTKLARELNDLLGIAPPINPDDPDDLLGAACQEAAGLLEKGDVLSDTAVEALKELGCADALKKIGIKTKKEGTVRPPSGSGKEWKELYFNLVEQKKFTRAQITAAIKEKFPELNPNTLSTYISDSKSEKWNKLPKLVVSDENGILSFR